MTVIKDVTGAVMPWVVLAGVAVAIYKYRDEILGWIKGEIAGPILEAPGKVAEYFTSEEYCERFPHAIQCLLKPKPAPAPYHVFTATPEERQENILNIPGLVIAPASWLPAAPAGPSALAIALGLTGDPVSGYTSVMPQLPETPKPLPGNTYQAFAHLDVNPDPAGYDLCKGGICLNLRPYAWNVDRVDASGRFVGNIAAAGGSDPAVWAQLRQYIGLVT